MNLLFFGALEKNCISEKEGTVSRVPWRVLNQLNDALIRVESYTEFHQSALPNRSKLLLHCTWKPINGSCPIRHVRDVTDNIIDDLT